MSPTPPTLLLAVLAGCAPGAAPARGPGAAEPGFEDYWYQGAEMSGYALTVQRYGEPREGRAVAISVTEPFREAAFVKADRRERDPEGIVDALKLNLVRDFPTGVYDYDTMTSLFVRADDLSPMKVSFSSAEWCGHVYEELVFDGDVLRADLHSYFEGESGRRELPVTGDLMTGDELFVRLRGLRGPWIEPGGTRRVRLLPAAFLRRLTHAPLAPVGATIERRAEPASVRVPAGLFAVDVYLVHTDDGRRGRFDVERAHPRRIVRWAWTRDGVPYEGADAGVLLDTTLMAYWERQDRADAGALRELGLDPDAR